MKPAAELKASCGSEEDHVNKNKEDEDDVFPLPGFRFHPTDEELVGFYLRRKVEKRPIKLDLIKQVDIYKYDPWDLPSPSSKDHESYFFCKRGRKYRNSIRPNRVTGSGFWKATGIDKHVYSEKRDSNPHGHDPVIGLKKTLVYYRGSAGKGTKTDWMMHEFRLPTSDSSSNNTNTKTSDQEAEVWTLCRIFKRNVSSRKYTPDWRDLASNKRVQLEFQPLNPSAKLESHNNGSHEAHLIHFGGTAPTSNAFYPQEKRSMANAHHPSMLAFDQPSSEGDQAAPLALHSTCHPPSTPGIPDAAELFAYGSSWDELRSVVDLALDRSSL